MGKKIVRKRSLPASKLNVYRERHYLVAFLAKLFPHSWTIDESEPDPRFRNVICIDSPAGQLSWHVPDEDLELFPMPKRWARNTWDGHTTEEKYRRLASLKVRTPMTQFHIHPSEIGRNIWSERTIRTRRVRAPRRKDAARAMTIRFQT